MSEKMKCSQRIGRGGGGGGGGGGGVGHEFNKARDQFTNGFAVLSLSLISTHSLCRREKEVAS